jgi:aminoglycoside 3'-phosphotransferase-1
MARDNVGHQVRQSIDCISPMRQELFLKHGKGSVANDVTDEMVRLTG